MEVGTELLILGDLASNFPAQKMVSQFYRTLNFKNNQIIITHTQGVDWKENSDNPLLASFHFYSDGSINQGYHCFAGLFTHEIKNAIKNKKILEDISFYMSNSPTASSYILKENGQWKKTKNIFESELKR